MTPKFRLAVQYATEAGNIPTRPKFRRWVSAALMQECEIVLRIVDKQEGYDLNFHYRGKPYATNVLTFIYDDLQPLTGDIVLCADIVEKEAQQQRKELTAHYAHLTVHGVLHLQGYDHMQDDEAMVMEQLETKILAQFGYPTPYRDYISGQTQ